MIQMESRLNDENLEKNMNIYSKLDHEKQAWKVREAADFLGYSPKYVYELIKQGKIQGWFKLNGRYKFCPAELKLWVEKHFGINQRRAKAAGAGADDTGQEKENKST